jgi:hypothetical protein
LALKTRLLQVNLDNQMVNLAVKQHLLQVE